jgi:L-aminopeptidase/D-esterase-like protein
VASVDVRGGAPATRETDLLRTGNLVERVHAVLLSGGSAYGLDAATGVMRWLEEREIGYPVTNAVVPIVPAACIYDFSIGNSGVRPDAAAGYAACEGASADPLPAGSVGAGSGATVGKALGMERAMKGGIGSAVERTASGIAVGAVVAVNCWGEVVDPNDGRVIAGPRGENPGEYEDSIEALRKNPPLSPFSNENSTVGVVATDAMLTKEQAYRVAVIAQTGLARTIRPVHTPVDGDLIFSLATCLNDAPTDVLQIGALAARAVERAIISAVLEATSLDGMPTASEWRKAR